MNGRKYFGFDLLILIIFIGMGIWWLIPTSVIPLTKSAELAPPTEAKPAQQTSPDTPKLLTSSMVAPVVEPPVAPPVAPSMQNSAVAPSPLDPNGDPQADLSTAIPDLVHLARAGDFLSIYLNYTPPGKVNPDNVRTEQTVLQRIARAKATDPKLRQIVQAQDDAAARAYEALESQAPTFSDAGDEATYMYLPDPELVPNGVPYPMIFVKIDGKWYMKPPEQGTITIVNTGH